MSICRRCIVKVLSVHIGAMMTYLRVSIEFTRPLNAKSEVKSNKSFLLIKSTFFGWIYIGLVLRGCEVVETSWSWCPVLTWARFIRGRGWDPSPCESQAGPGEETIGGPGATARPGQCSHWPRPRHILSITESRDTRLHFSQELTTLLDLFQSSCLSPFSPLLSTICVNIVSDSELYFVLTIGLTFIIF